MLSVSVMQIGSFDLAADVVRVLQSGVFIYYVLQTRFSKLPVEVALLSMWLKFVRIFYEAKS